jgi:hypothetical protein
MDAFGRTFDCSGFEESTGVEVIDFTIKENKYENNLTF